MQTTFLSILDYGSAGGSGAEERLCSSFPWKQLRWGTSQTLPEHSGQKGNL